MEEICGLAAKDIRARYTIGYFPQEAHSRQRRHLRVEAKAEGLGKPTAQTTASCLFDAEKKMKIRLKHKRFAQGSNWMANLFLLFGLLLIDIWLWSNTAELTFQAWQNWVFDQELQGKSVTLSAYLRAETEQAAIRSKGLLGLDVPTPPIPGEIKRPTKLVPSNALVGRLSIPRLHLAAAVREGADESTLRLALGHIAHTALPGEPGNVGVAGHRDTLFRPLRNIRKDDVITFETVAGNHTYKVESTEIVTPDQVGVLKPGPYSELTLVTCYPFYYIGSAPKRFIVKARELPANADIARSAPQAGNAVR